MCRNQVAFRDADKPLTWLGWSVSFSFRMGSCTFWFEVLAEAKHPCNGKWALISRQTRKHRVEYPVHRGQPKNSRPGRGLCFAVFGRDTSKWIIHEVKTTKWSKSTGNKMAAASRRNFSFQDVFWNFCSRCLPLTGCMLQSSWIQLLFVNSHFVNLRPLFTDLVAYINYAYVMYFKYFFNIFHTAPQAAII